MTPDDLAGDQPTKPLPQEPGAGAAPDPGPTEPIIAPHVPVANLSTGPLDPVGAAGPIARPERSRAFVWGLIAAVAVLAVLLVVVLTAFWGDQPTPAITPTPTTSSSPTVTAPPSQPPADETPSDEPEEPAPEPTTPPEPTDPPDPDPTGTPAAEAT